MVDFKKYNIYFPNTQFIRDKKSGFLFTLQIKFLFFNKKKISNIRTLKFKLKHLLSSTSFD
jgi:hypothetical protein